jgi:ABC-type antimicrobial peptide transport system permease subunit
MIKPAEKKKMKKVFKGGYSKEVQEKLNEKGIVTKKGTPYGISYITHIFNGINENLAIEETIVELYAEKVKQSKEEKQNTEKKKKEIFSTKKPEAGTPGLI